MSQRPSVDVAARSAPGRSTAAVIEPLLSKNFFSGALIGKGLLYRCLIPRKGADVTGAILTPCLAALNNPTPS